MSYAGLDIPAYGVTGTFIQALIGALIEAFRFL
jgi:hypothetical protein